MGLKKSFIQIFCCLVMGHMSLQTVRPVIPQPVVAKAIPKISTLERVFGQPIGAVPKQFVSTSSKQVQQKMIDTMVDQLAPPFWTMHDLMPQYRPLKSFTPSAHFGMFKGTRTNFFRASDQQPVIESSSMSLQEAQTILNISNSASVRDIKAAYRKLLQIIHPDMGGTRAEFERLKLAYEIALRGSIKPGALVPKGWPQGLPYLDTDVDLKSIGLGREPGKRFAIEIKDVSPLVGKGGFALEFILQGSIIQEYTGSHRVVHHSLLPKLPYALSVGVVDRATNKVDYGSNAGEYQLIVDAQFAGNETRFFNHSKNPNTYFTMDPRLLGPIFVVALRDIQPGEEITVSYGDDYWKDKEQKPV